MCPWPEAHTHGSCMSAPAAGATESHVGISEPALDAQQGNLTERKEAGE